MICDGIMRRLAADLCVFASLGVFARNETLNPETGSRKDAKTRKDAKVSGKSTHYSIANHLALTIFFTSSIIASSEGLS